jgi:hypothetical protein
MSRGLDRSDELSFPALPARHRAAYKNKTWSGVWNNRIMLWLRRLFDKSASPFSPLEQSLLTELQSRLSPEGQALLKAQLAAIDLVQHEVGCTGANCYARRRGKLYRDPALRFPAQATELRFATMQFRCEGDPKKRSASFWLVRGHFFSIAFSPGAKDVLRNGKLHVDTFKLLHDPMLEAPEIIPPEGGKKVSSLRGWAKNWADNHEIEECLKPLSSDQRDNRLIELDTTLPADYLEFVAQTDGIETAGFHVYGLSGVYSVPLAGATYLVLVDLEDAAVLAVQYGAKDGVVYYVEHDGDGPVALGASIKTALDWSEAKASAS